MSILERSDRNEAIDRFLTQAGWDGAERKPLGEDASTRRYERIHKNGQIAILMDAPPSNESQPCPPEANENERILGGWNARTRLAACRVDAFVGVGNHLKSLGLSAPEVYSFDIEQGFALLEDLGDSLYADAIPAGEDELDLYEAAIDALVHIHTTPVPSALFAGNSVWPIQDYDRLAITTGADLFSKWYPKYDPRVSFGGDLTRAIDESCFQIATYLESLPKVLMIRDYHAENLLWLPDREGLARVGILDFQDAVSGPAAWDIAMFVQDARRDVSPSVQESIVKRYAEATGQNLETFTSDLAKAGALNALRILGVFARLVFRDKKPKYEAFMEREWGHLEDSLVHPDLARLRELVAKAAPFRERLQ